MHAMIGFLTHCWAAIYDIDATPWVFTCHIYSAEIIQVALGLHEMKFACFKG